MTEAAIKREQKRRSRLTPTARRALIDEAATQVFAESGYETATMQDIARAAGVVASVLYDHYSSKRELYIELLEQHGRTLIERTIRAPVGPDARAELRSQINDYFSTVKADPFVWRFLIRDPPGDPQILAAHEKVQATAAAEIAAVLESDREPMQATEMVAEMIKASLSGLAAWWWSHPDVRQERLVDIAIAVIWDGLAAVSQGPRS
jgi:AcrR family transcriptional regulator